MLATVTVRQLNYSIPRLSRTPFHYTAANRPISIVNLLTSSVESSCRFERRTRRAFVPHLGSSPPQLQYLPLRNLNDINLPCQRLELNLSQWHRVFESRQLPFLDLESPLVLLLFAQCSPSRCPPASTSSWSSSRTSLAFVRRGSKLDSEHSIGCNFNVY